MTILAIIIGITLGAGICLLTKGDEKQSLWDNYTSM
jgi:hypothetical protein